MSISEYYTSRRCSMNMSVSEYYTSRRRSIINNYLAPSSRGLGH